MKRFIFEVSRCLLAGGVGLQCSALARRIVLSHGRVYGARVRHGVGQGLRQRLRYYMPRWLTHQLGGIGDTPALSAMLQRSADPSRRRPVAAHAEVEQR
jgi:hypothetical protein